jgi:putative addiction module CopG family antidote
MTLQISLPENLENMVQNKVASGSYGDASELVSEALACFFSENELTEHDFANLREDVEKRRQNLKNGVEHWVDGEDFFARMEQKFS